MKGILGIYDLRYKVRYWVSTVRFDYKSVVWVLFEGRKKKKSKKWGESPFSIVTIITIFSIYSIPRGNLFPSFNMAGGEPCFKIIMAKAALTIRRGSMNPHSKVCSSLEACSDMGRGGE